MSSLLHIKHFTCFHHYIVIAHNYHYYPSLHVTNRATCRWNASNLKKTDKLGTIGAAAGAKSARATAKSLRAAHATGRTRGAAGSGRSIWPAGPLLAASGRPSDPEPRTSGRWAPETGPRVMLRVAHGATRTLRLG